MAERGPGAGKLQSHLMLKAWAPDNDYIYLIYPGPGQTYGLATNAIRDQSSLGAMTSSLIRSGSSQNRA